MRTTADRAGGRSKDWEAPGAALVRSAATDRIPALADLGRVHIMGIASSGMSAGRAASWSCAGPPRWKTAGASR